MTNDEQANDITELQAEETKAVVGGASAIEYGLIAASISKAIIAEMPKAAAPLDSAFAKVVQKLK